MAAILPVGTELNGKYRVERHLGSGGFGNTYLVSNTFFHGRQAVVKEFFIKGVNERNADSTTLSVSNRDNQDLFETQLAKFKKEAKRIGQLNHPHIISVQDYFEENGTAYYVMDYVDGESLSERRKRLGKLSEDEVVGLLPGLVSALIALHESTPAIYHLDIKPANLMCYRDGRVVLIDFGASKCVDPKTGATSLSQVAYTRGYAPTEQENADVEAFGPYTDFYAVGACIYNLLTGDVPPTTIRIIEDTTPDKRVALAMPGVSEQLRRLVVWLMQTHRNARPQRGQEILNYIHDVIRGGAQPLPLTPRENEDTVVGRGEPGLSEAERNRLKEVEEKEAFEQASKAYREKISKRGRVLLWCLLGFVGFCILVMLSVRKKSNYESYDDYYTPMSDTTVSEETVAVDSVAVDYDTAYSY